MLELSNAPSMSAMSKFPVLLLSLLLCAACSVQSVKDNSKSASGEVAKGATAVANGAVEAAKVVKDTAVEAYHGAGDIGKQIGNDAATAGKEVGRKTKETFSK